MPFTSEELDELQKEAELEFEKENASSEDSKKDAENKVEDEVKKEEEKPEEKLEDKKEDEPVDDLSVDEIRELRKQLRELTDSYGTLSSKNERLEKILKEKGLIDEEDEKAQTESEAAARKVYEERVASLEQMLSTMRLIPGYTDVDEVVSQENFDDIVAAYAQYYVKQNGGKLGEVIKEVEIEIWKKPNPYSYMYDIIKKHHPKYAEVKKTEPEKKAVKEEEVAPSLQKTSGGGSVNDGAGWTAAKLDEMDEDEITAFKKSNPDIYAKYMKGDLK